ncbi:hypothetical protein GQ53DRAFT_812723 [Thozetella sp. PMI_491]|nr:hypothetical protein GQ53DRAFT_812723 [Thozetella sp. PMI_491]
MHERWYGPQRREPLEGRLSYQAGGPSPSVSSQACQVIEDALGLEVATRSAVAAGLGCSPRQPSCRLGNITTLGSQCDPGVGSEGDLGRLDWGRAVGHDMSDVGSSPPLPSSSLGLVPIVCRPNRADVHHWRAVQASHDRTQRSNVPHSSSPSSASAEEMARGSGTAYAESSLLLARAASGGIQAASPAWLDGIPPSITHTSHGLYRTPRGCRRATTRNQRAPHVPRRALQRAQGPRSRRGFLPWGPRFHGGGVRHGAAGRS